MKESNWEDCLKSHSVLKTSIDKAKANSLKEISLGRIKYLEKQDITKDTSNYIFEGYYASLNELLHSIASSKGYKILNHVCIGFFLKEILKKEDLFRTFDDLRFKRNGLAYYGKEMEFEVAKDAILKSKKLIKELKHLKTRLP